jgi:hypothetical protein
MMKLTKVVLLSICLSGISAAAETAETLPPVQGVAAQPLRAQAQRVAEALQFLGQPLTEPQQAALQAALKETDKTQATDAIQRVLDPLVLAAVKINPESRVKVVAGPAKRELLQHGWTMFLLKVHNQAGVTAPLRVTSPNSAPVYRQSSGTSKPTSPIGPEHLENRWMTLESYDKRPLMPKLSGLELEYRIVMIYSRDAGQREATLSFDVGQGTQDLGFRNELALLFNCRPAVVVELQVLDHDGEPTTGQFIIRDAKQRIFPARSKRLAPDFFFHDQIYRHSGETVLLPAGEYEVTYTRGPEYRILKKNITVPNVPHHKETFTLKRWIKLVDHNWYSGDHHIHAAGCAHYDAPSQGVEPNVMMRHILGEDLNVGCVLSWGPCWYHQKEFFSGQLDKASRPGYLMRYDVEVSGFPSSHAGHLCLLNLNEDDYTYSEPQTFDWTFDGEQGRFEGRTTERLGQWPSWNLPILKWGQAQGGVVGYSHSGWGLAVPETSLPNYRLPPFDGIGANEYIVDVVHGACDFISAVDTPSSWELNIWYHTLNCGYRCRISGETDFPCIYGDRVGLGRVYVKIDDGPLTYERWIRGIRDGRSYCSDGLSHLFDFEINGLGVGEKTGGSAASTLAVKSGEPLKVKVKAAALLDQQPNEAIRKKPLTEKPYWHIERVRIGDSRRVPVELVVNGQPVERREIVADGTVSELSFDYQPTISSWVALRILPAAHTNPIFVELDGKPIRASKKSAKWCLESVDQCWKSKMPLIREHERAAAAAAFDVAREAYRNILDESHDDLGN